MTESNFDEFDPTTLVMDSTGCAFNNSSFFDRLLHVCISPDPIDSTQSPSVKTFHISSQILAARSPFFDKLFSNGMEESKQCYATLRINASEETGLMELLKFMYGIDFTVTSASDVVDVLIAADKFDAPSCMTRCSRLLRNLLTKNPEFVLVYLGLPSNILMAEALEPLTLAAKQSYAVHYKDITKFEDEILRLPLADVEAIIASDDLQATSEDAVYLFVLKWARSHYPNIEERREIIMTRLAKFIRYPYMTLNKLQEFLSSNEFEPFFASYTVKEAIYFQYYDLNPDLIMDDDCQRFVEREAYKYRPVKTHVLPVKTLLQVGFHWARFILNRLRVIKGLTWVILVKAMQYLIV